MARSDLLPAGTSYAGVIAIDGPAAAGKTTVARHLARRLGIGFFDTGVLYRLVTLEAIRNGIPLDNASELAEIAANLDVTIAPDDRVLLAGEDVSEAIRTPPVDAAVSQVAAHPEVRAGLLPVQRRIASHGPVVIVGRDITTVVVPDAGLRVFLSASPEERARRRYLELQTKGIDIPEGDVLADIRRRDLADSTRPVAPLRAGPGAVVVDTDGLSIDQVVDRLASLAGAG